MSNTPKDGAFCTDEARDAVQAFLVSCQTRGLDMGSVIHHLRQACLPEKAPRGLLVSMALRDDHGLGVPGYYDGLQMLFDQHRPPAGSGPADRSRAHEPGCRPPSHAQRMDAAIQRMRSLYEEISGRGFYSPDQEAAYCAIAERPAAVSANPSELPG